MSQSNQTKYVTVPTAMGQKNNFDLSCTHLTTSDWFQFQPVYNRELVPGQKISIDANVFSRLNPLPVPTLGGGQIEYKAFFVPYRTIFPDWNKFITNSLAWTNNGVDYDIYPPVINTKTIGTWLKRYSYRVYSSSSSAVGTDIPAYDFSYKTMTSNQPVITYNKFGYVGRFAMKIFRTLGYQPFFVDEVDGIGNPQGYNLNALPLFALAKIYLDWYINTQYADSLPAYRALEVLLNHRGDGSYEVTDKDLDNIFGTIMYAIYDYDYFVGAWDNPFSPSDATSPVNNIGFTHLPIILDDGVSGAPPRSVVQSDIEQGAKLLPPTSGINEYMLTALHALSDYVKRQQLAGALPLDRYLATFGITLSAEALLRSNYLGSVGKTLQFGAVLSNSSTSDAVLGDFAGQGVAIADNVNFNFETKEFGQLIIVQTIKPKIGYVQGIDRNLFHRQLTDFFIPDFDALGTQAISSAELYTSYNIPTMANEEYYQQIFGFTPRYSEYKTQRDLCTGDFALPSLPSQGAWHTFRLFSDDTFGTASNVVHSPQFTFAFDNNQYNRLFYNHVTLGSSGLPSLPSFSSPGEYLQSLDETYQTQQDNFNVVIRFDINTQFAAKPLYHEYKFHSNGQDVTLNLGGSKVG